MNLVNPKGDFTEVNGVRLHDPAIGVGVKDAVIRDNVIAAFVEWFVHEQIEKKIIRKGLAIFALNGQKILKRHIYLLLSVSPLSKFDIRPCELP
jgi:hypothetical protein